LDSTPMASENSPNSREISNYLEVLLFCLKIQ
jgi:hypothetical protein